MIFTKWNCQFWKCVLLTRIGITKNIDSLKLKEAQNRDLIEYDGNNIDYWFFC